MKIEKRKYLPYFYSDMSLDTSMKWECDLKWIVIIYNIDFRELTHIRRIVGDSPTFGVHFSPVQLGTVRYCRVH